MPSDKIIRKTKSKTRNKPSKKRTRKTKSKKSCQLFRLKKDVLGKYGYKNVITKTPLSRHYVGYRELKKAMIIVLNLYHCLED